MRLLPLWLLLLPQPALAAAAKDTSGAAVSVDEATAVAAIVGDGAGTPLSLDLPDGAWLLAGGTLGPERAGTVMALSEQLAQARAKMANLETTDAMALLRQAVSSLPSSSAAVEPDDLFATLELLGQAGRDEGQDDVARAAYRQLLAARPAFGLSTPPGTV